VAAAARDGRCILTQDLDFSASVALSGRTGPSVISLRLSSSRVERVNAVLQEALPGLEKDLLEGAIVTAQDGRIRRPRSRVLLSCRLTARATRVGRPPASARVRPTGSWSAAS
jgi:hypothetical protein